MGVGSSGGELKMRSVHLLVFACLNLIGTCAYADAAPMPGPGAQPPSARFTYQFEGGCGGVQAQERFMKREIAVNACLAGKEAHVTARVKFNFKGKPEAIRVSGGVAAAVLGCVKKAYGALVLTVDTQDRCFAIVKIAGKG